MQIIITNNTSYPLKYAGGLVPLGDGGAGAYYLSVQAARAKFGYDGANALSILGGAGVGVNIGANNAAGIIVINAAGSVVTVSKAISMNAAPVYMARTNTAYGVNVAITTTAANSFVITPTDGVAYNVSNPTQDNTGQIITVLTKNTFGVLGAATFGGNYKLGAAWVQPANGFSRSISFLCLGAGLWVEIFRTAVDVAN